MEIKTPVKTNTDKFTGYTYIIEGKDTILARCNSETVAAAIAKTINDATRLQAIEAAVWKLAEHPDSEATKADLLRLIGVEL